MSATAIEPLRALAQRRLLVTGGTGFLGQHVVRQAVQAGAEVHVLTRKESSEGSVRFHASDLANGESVGRVVRQVRPDAIIHLAAAGVAYGSSNPAELRRINISGFTALLEAAATLPSPPRVVSAGSGFEYAPANRPLREDDPIQPNTEYGGSKTAALAEARRFASQLAITWVRLFSVYGPGELEPRLAPHVIGCARRGQVVDLTAGEQVRDYAFAGDIAEALLRATASLPPLGEVRVVNFASGREVTLREFIVLLADLLAARGFRPTLNLGAKPYRPDEMMHYTADLARWKSIFGWLPERTLERGLAETIDAIL